MLVRTLELAPNVIGVGQESVRASAFFVLEPEVLDYIEGDNTQFELKPLERLAKDGQLMAYKHTSFWQCMDTVREKHLLEDLWKKDSAPWKTWR